jgi:2-polyprenyl-3-methyl-5-hydroxy-6-metoxy-1,4-benzoquinol methylase
MMDTEALPLNEDLWGYRKRLQFVVSSIEDAFRERLCSDIRILDVGCGSASHLGLPLARMGYGLTGVDMHEPSITVASDNAEGLDNAHFIFGRVEDIPDEFDVVILSEVLEHVPEPARLLAASLPRLKGGGLVIITVPNGYGEFEWDSWVFRGLGLERLVENYVERKQAKENSKPVTSSTENKDNRHIQFFTMPRLRSIFAAAGLEIVREQGSTLLSGPFAGHLLGRFNRFVEWNTRVTDNLPITMASGWYFALRRRDEVQQ